MTVGGRTIEQTPTSYQPDIPGQPRSLLTPEQESILAFLAAYPHASTDEIAPTTSHNAARCRLAMDALMVRGYVKHSTKRFEGWVAVPWMFDPNGIEDWPQSRAPIEDMAELRNQQAIDEWRR